jgi:hypothetical protein
MLFIEIYRLKHEWFVVQITVIIHFMQNEFVRSCTFLGLTQFCPWLIFEVRNSTK